MIIKLAGKIPWALVCSFTLIGCAGVKYRAPVTEGPRPEVIRHLAWMEGDLENEFEPNRNVAQERIQKWEGNIPKLEDRERYLEYVATLDASGDIKSAEKKIGEYLAKYPQDKNAVFLLAAHHMRVGRKELASYLFHQLEKDDEFKWKAPVLNNLGMLALKEKNRIVALDYFEKASKSDPASAAPLVNLGSIYLQSRSWSDAEKLFARARELDASFEDASVGLALALEGQDKFEQAHSVYTEHLDQNSEATTALFNNAVLLAGKLKRKEEAGVLMQRYLQRGGKETARAHEFLQNWR